MVELDLAYKKEIADQNKERQDAQEELYYYYNGDKDKILQYLDSALAKTFDEDTIEDFQKDYLNITKKLIQETSVIYSEPASRTILINDNEDEKATEAFNKSLTTRINSKDKKIHRFGKLFNTAIMEVFYNEFTKKIDFRIDSPHKYTIVPHPLDDFRIGMLFYDKYLINEKTNKEEIYTIVWTETEHYKVDTHGNKTAIKSKLNKNGTATPNPYMITPFAIYRTEEMEDFWGVGQHDIITANEIINVFLTDLANGVIMDAWGTPLFVNCGLDKKADDDDGDGVKTIRIGPKHPITVDNVSADMVAPRIEYVSHNGQIQGVIDYIDWRIKLLAANKGIDPNVFLQEVKATSGFSKVMDRINQIEIREDDLEPAREFEEERFEIIKKVNNYWAQFPETGLTKIDENATIQVDFAEIGIPETEDEKWKRREESEKRNMGTAITWLIEENPDLEVEQAEEIIRKNKAINDEMKSEPATNFEKLLNTPNEVKGEEENVQEN